MEVRVYDSQGPLLDSFKLVNEEARKASSPDNRSTLESTGVRAIGLRSPSPVTGLTFGTGVRWESFHRPGNTPDDTEQLKIAVTGSASLGANSLRRRAGIPSGPEAL